MGLCVRYFWGIVWIVLLVPALTGCCQTFCHSVPVGSVCGPRYFDAPRSSQEPVDFVCLRQDPPPVYQLGPRDVLGIYIEGVLGSSDTPPPVHFPEQADIPPAIGFPIPVREDGTLSLPLVPPIDVTGLTLAQAEQEIRKAYIVDKKVLQPDRGRIIVTLMKPRTYQVTVIREDRSVLSMGMNGAILGNAKRGMSYSVELCAYENDVLHALSASGGLPGVDAKNEVKILRGTFEEAQQWNQFMTTVEDPETPNEILTANPNTITIPLRITPGGPPVEFTQEDIILATGDIVFIESRDAEIFYTGGLLKGGQHRLPRDYDLDVLGAIAMAGESVTTSIGAKESALGFGKGQSSIIPPSRVIIVRTINGRQTLIRIDLKRAMVNPQERLLIQPEDIVMLEYTCLEMTGNIILGLLQFNYILGVN